MQTQMANAPSTTAAETGTALRIRFVEQLPPGPAPLASFAHPATCFALAEKLTTADLLRLPVGPRPDDDQLRLLMLPAGMAAPQELQREAEEWMHHGGLSAGQPTVDLMLRSERILWRPGQSLLIGPPERLEELLPGLIEFAYCEGELRGLEEEIDGDWPVIEADIDLTHSVNADSLANRAHVDEMTVRTTRRRMRFARLEPCLEKPSISLPGPARRLASELATQAEVIDRLGWLNDKLEVAEDLYELANDRLTEFSYFHREYRLELWIIVLLVAEVVIMTLELLYWVKHP